MDEGTKLPSVPRDRSYYSTRALKYTHHPAGPRTGSLDSLSLRRRRSAAAGHVVERAWANRSTVGGPLGSRSLI